MSTSNGCIAFYDEASSFLDSLGRYSSSSGSGAKYERGIYSSIFSAPGFYNRTTVRNEINLTKPRFNFCLAAHPAPIHTILKNEKKSYSDGLFARILIAAPKPPFKHYNSISDAPEPGISLTSILFMISKMHMVGVEFTFDQDASAAAGKLFTKFSTLSERANKANNSFLA